MDNQPYCHYWPVENVSGLIRVPWKFKKFKIPISVVITD